MLQLSVESETCGFRKILSSSILNQEALTRSTVSCFRSIFIFFSAQIRKALQIEASVTVIIEILQFSDKKMDDNVYYTKAEYNALLILHRSSRDRRRVTIKRLVFTVID